MLNKDDLKAILDIMSPYIDARAKTTELFVKAEIKSSEERTKKELRGEIKSSEERTKKELRGEIKSSEERIKKELRTEILVSRAEAKADILALSTKIIKSANEQDKRLDALENDTGVTNPNKN